MSRFTLNIKDDSGMREVEVDLSNGRILLLGRDETCDITLLSASASRRHLALTWFNGRVNFTDMSGAGLVLFSSGMATRLEQGELRHGDRVFAGDVLVSLVGQPERGFDPHELALLADLQRDDSRRAVYADWLESAGRAAEAEWVRVELMLQGLNPQDAQFERGITRLRELYKSVAAEFRAVVSRPAIEKCDDPRFSFRCPQKWEALALTGEADIRFCVACRENVFFCNDVAEGVTRAREGKCVAVDVSRVRSANDLDPPVMRMGRDFTV